MSARRRRTAHRRHNRVWLPPRHLSSGQVAQALGVSQDEVRRQRDVLGGVKQPNRRLAYPADRVRAELLHRGLPVPAWFPSTLEEQRRRDRRDAFLGRAGAVGIAGLLGWALLFTGDEPTAPVATTAGQSEAVRSGATAGGHGLPNSGTSTGGSGAQLPQVRSATPTAVCRDGTVSYSANRRGTCSHHGGVAHWGPPDAQQTYDQQALPGEPPADAPLGPDATAVGDAGDRSEEMALPYNGECAPVAEDVIDRLAQMQPDGVDVRLASGWALDGQRGTVVGGYLHGIAHGALVDGAFGSWYVSAADDTVHRYTDYALTLSAWPQIGDGRPTPLSARVLACAAANAG